MSTPISTQSVLARTLEVQRVQEAYQQNITNQQHEFAAKLQQIVQQRQVQVQHPERPEHEPIQTQEHGGNKRESGRDRLQWKSNQPEAKTEKSEEHTNLDSEHHILDIRI
jgi:hypothetical protein